MTQILQQVGQFLRELGADIVKAFKEDVMMPYVLVGIGSFCIFLPLIVTQHL